MTNEEKILSMLDLIASEVKGLKETSVTKEEFKILKDELRGFKEQTVDRFNKLGTENNVAHETILAKIDKQSESFGGKFDVLNRRLFNQEAELSVLKKREAL